MTGDADLYVPAPVLRHQTRLIAGARSVVIAESGHCPNWEQPEQFNQSLIEFLSNATSPM
jgi:pimeloyl-ACP methyl ester carboxylesterase